MEQNVGAGLAPAQQKGAQQSVISNQHSADKKPLSLEGKGKGEGGRRQSGPIHCIKPELKELDRLRLERLNLSIGNLNLQLALLNERARALQIEMAGFRAEREGLVKGITEGHGLDGKYRLNPDAMTFEEIKAEKPLSLEGRGKGEGEKIGANNA